MAIGPDRIQVLKYEEAAKGGDAADDTMGIPTEISPQEDVLESAGVYLQDALNRDENVYIDRDGDDLRFRDVNNPTPVTLSAIVAASVPSLDSVITSGAIDNDVIISAANPIIWRDNSVSLTPLSIIKSNAGGVGISVTVAGSTLPAVRAIQSTQQTDLVPTGIRKTGSTAALTIIHTVQTGPVHILGGDSTSASKAGGVLVSAGNNFSSGDGGDTTIRGGGVLGAGTSGRVIVGATNTSSIDIGAASIPTNVIGNLNLDSDGSLDGTVNKTAGILISDLASNVNDAKIITVDSNPNGQATEVKGSLAIDPVTPALYQNTDGATAWSEVGSSGGGGPNYAFTYTQATDGGSVSAGEWSVVLGSSGTPSGITRIRFSVTDADGETQTPVLVALGQGNFIKLWKNSDPTEWYIYRVTGGASLNVGPTTATVNVAWVGDSGGTLDEANDWNFHVYSGSNIQVVSSTHSYECTFAANTNWHTYSFAGHGSSSFNRDLGSATPGVGIDARWGAFMAPAPGEILDVSVGGRTPTATINSIELRLIKAVTAVGSTTTTNTDLTGFPFLTMNSNPANSWSELPTLYISGNKTLTTGDMFGIIIRRQNVGAATSFFLTVTYRMLTGV